MAERTSRTRDSIDSAFPEAGATRTADELRADERADAVRESLGDGADLEALELTDATWSIYALMDDGTAPPGPKTGTFVRKYSGPLDLERLQQLVGGGCYRLVAKLPDRTRKWLVVRLAGQPTWIHAAQAAGMIPGQSTALGAGAAATGLAGELAAVRAMLEDTRRMLEQARAAPPTTPVDPMQLFTHALTFARQLIPPAQPQSIETVQAMLGMFERGVKTGERSEGGFDMGAVVRELAPTIIAAFKPAPAAPPTIVLENPAPPAVPAPAVAGVVDIASARAVIDRRIEMLADVLARGATIGTPPGELVDALVTIIPEQSLDELAAATPELLMLRIGPATLSLYPILERPEGIDYVNAFLAELRRTDDESAPN